MPGVSKSAATVEVLWAFLKLGVRSFGGPIAHIGYFRQEFVVRRRWLEDSVFSDLLALCQFLPGPASSQVGFSIGLMRAGYWGGLAAWIGFTLPSAAALVLFAGGVSALRGPTGRSLSHGLALVAVAIVAQAVWGMARTLCPDARRASIACAAALIIRFVPASFSQIAAILFGGIAGLWLCRTAASAPAATLAVPVSRGVALVSLAIFSALAAAAILLQGMRLPSGLALFNAFYRSGAMVFGGGHVVLPLLRDAFVTPGWISDGAFLAGYGAAQAVPGPLFSFAAYLGAAVDTRPHGLAGAALGLFGIFLPGMLILIAALPYWGTLRALARAQALMRGINASVVGLLGAALYDPVWSRSVTTAADAAVALAGFVLLTFWRAPPLLVVVLGALAGIGLGLTRAAVV